MYWLARWMSSTRSSSSPRWTPIFGSPQTADGSPSSIKPLIFPGKQHLARWSLAAKRLTLLRRGALLVSVRVSPVCVLVLLLARDLRAQDLERSPASPAEAGLAGAGVVAVRGADALWINPAGLSSSRWQVITALGVQHAERSVQLTTREVNAQAPPEARDLSGVDLAPAVALSAPLGRSGISLALGYRTGLLTSSTYQTDGHPLRYLANRLALRQHIVSLGAAFRWRWLALGAALELSHLQLEVTRSLWAGLEADRDQLQDPRQDLTATFDGADGVTVTGLFGLRLRPTRWLQLGLSLRPPVTAALSGTLGLTVAPDARPPEGYDAMDARGSPARLDLDLPLELRGGVTLRPRSWIAIHLESRHRRWSAPATLLADPPADVVLSTGNQRTPYPVVRIPLSIAANDDTSFHLGLELPRLLGLLSVRAGYAFHTATTPASLPSPVALELGRHVIGMGLEARRGRLRVGAALQRSLRQTLTSEGEEAVIVNPLDPGVTERAGPGRYSSNSTRAIVSIGLVL